MPNTSKLARFTLLPLAIAQFIVPLLPALGWGQAIGTRAIAQGQLQDVGSLIPLNLPPELPPGGFFAIWGVIFTLYLIAALLALFKPALIEDALAPPLAVAALGNSLWMLATQSLGIQALSFLLLIPILLSAWAGAYQLNRIGGWDGTARKLLYNSLLGLLSGWLCVALAISLPGLVRQALNLGPSDQAWASLWLTLVPAGLLSFIFSRFVSANLWFFVALSWGLLGIFANTWLRTGTHALGLVALMAIYALWHIRLAIIPQTGLNSWGKT